MTDTRDSLQGELLTCDWCGSKPNSQWMGCHVPGMEDCGTWEVSCCHAYVHKDTQEEAEEVWNTRTPKAALQAGAGGAQDAARYRWLRDHCNYGVMGSDNPSFALNCDEPIAEWDAAIDRELAQATEGE